MSILLENIALGLSGRSEYSVREYYTWAVRDVSILLENIALGLSGRSEYYVREYCTQSVREE